MYFLLGVPQTEESAATAEPAEPQTEGKKQEEEEEIDIDLDDPATEKAALKIQAGFRGYKTRKEFSQGRQISSGGFYFPFLVSAVFSFSMAGFLLFPCLVVSHELSKLYSKSMSWQNLHTHIS